MDTEQNKEQGGNSSEQQQEEKRFTQSEVDALIGKRLARAMKDAPDESELAAFRAWKSNHTDDGKNGSNQQSDRLAEELATAREELEQLKRDKYILNKGLSGDEAEFIAFKAGKLVTKDVTFEKAVDQLTKDRKQMSFDWAGKVGEGGTGSEKTASVMNQLIRNAFKS